MSIDYLQPSYYYLEYYDATKDTIEAKESKEYFSSVTMELFLTLCVPILVLLVFTCYVVTVLWRCYEKRNHPKVECSLCRKIVTTDSATQTDEMVGSPAVVIGRTYQAGSRLTMSAKPSEDFYVNIETLSKEMEDGVLMRVEHLGGDIESLTDQYSPVRPSLASCCY